MASPLRPQRLQTKKFESRSRIPTRRFLLLIHRVTLARFPSPFSLSGRFWRVFFRQTLGNAIFQHLEKLLDIEEGS